MSWSLLRVGLPPQDEREKWETMLTASQQQLGSVKAELLDVVDKYAKSQAEADVNRENFRVCNGIKESLQGKLRSARLPAR